MSTTAQRERGDSTLSDRYRAESIESPQSEQRSARIWVVSLFSTFAFALLLRLSFNLWIPHVNNFAACDAYEYIQNARALSTLAGASPGFLQDCLTCLCGTANQYTAQSVQSNFAAMKDFAISGPSFPVYLALSLFVSGAAQLPDYAAWPQLLTGQSILSALMCVFIALTTKECFDRRTGIVAGIFAALYPGFIVASGRLYCESFACTLLTMLCWLVVRGFRKGGNSLMLIFLSGFFMGTLQLARSVMAALSLVLIPLTAIQVFNKSSASSGKHSGARPDDGKHSAVQSHHNTGATAGSTVGAGSADKLPCHGSQLESTVIESESCDRPGSAASGTQHSEVAVPVGSIKVHHYRLFREGKGRVLAALIVLALGFAVPAAPWLCFQKLAFGGGGLVVDRVGRYNFFVGNNSDIGGWLSYPYPDGRGVESQGFSQLFQFAVGRSPERWIKLMMDKPARLFKFPWNDFKTAIGPFDHTSQVTFHQILFALAAAGLAFGSLRYLQLPGRRPDQDATDRAQIYGRLFLLGLFAFHCIYFLFITVPRYNLTAIPVVITFAAAGCCALLQQLKSKSTRSSTLALAGFCCAMAVLLWSPVVALLCEVFPGMSLTAVLILSCVLKVICLSTITSVAISLISRLDSVHRDAARLQAGLLALILAPVLCFPVRANGRWYEWSANLSVARGAVRQTLRVPCGDDRLTHRDLYVIFDTDGVKQFADGLSVRVNGISLREQPVIPGIALAETFDRVLEITPGVYQREGERQWDSLAEGAARGNLDLRQWSMILVPREFVAAACRRAAEEHQSFVEFKVDLANSSAQPIKLFGSYQQSVKERSIPSVAVSSWEKCFYGVENPAGLTDTRYDIKVPSQHVEFSTSDLSDEAGLQTGCFNIAMLLAPPRANGVLPNNLPGSSAASEGLADSAAAHTRLVSCSPLPDTTLSAERREVCDVKVKAPPVGDGGSAVLVARLRGKIRTSAGDVTGSVLISSEYADPTTLLVYKSPWGPRCQRPSMTWQEFEVVVPLPAKLNGRSSARFGINLSCADPDFGYKNVYHKLQGNVAFSDLRLEVFELPGNPLGLGHLVY